MQNKKILITGATSGIGEATLRRLLTSGASKILITGRRKERLKSLQQELSTSACPVIPFCFDIRERESVEQFVEYAKPELADLDILINNAGLAAGRDLFQDASIEDWEAMIDTNVKGLLYVTRAILPLMIARKSGHIVNIGSIAGHSVYPRGNVYCATKFAVRALNEALRVDTLGSGIRVTSVDPGMVETEFSLVRYKGDAEKAAEVYKGVTPLSPSDIADAIYWSLSRPKHVNIQEIVLTPTEQASTRDIARRPE